MYMHAAIYNIDLAKLEDMYDNSIDEKTLIVFIDACICYTILFYYCYILSL